MLIAHLHCSALLHHALTPADQASSNNAFPRTQDQGRGWDQQQRTRISPPPDRASLRYRAVNAGLCCRMQLAMTSTHTDPVSDACYPAARVGEFSAPEGPQDAFIHHHWGRCAMPSLL
jgi:hypothetical protein